MALTVPAQTLRSVAASIKQLSYVPSSWQQQLTGLGGDARKQLEELLVQLVQEGGQPRLMALVLEKLASQQEALQRERDAWSFVWSGPEALHSKTADTFATVDQLIREAKQSLLIATYNVGESQDTLKQLKGIAARLEKKQLASLTLVIHPKQREGQIHNTCNPSQEISDWFFEEIWPWKAVPLLYVDRRILSPGWRWGPYQHSKAIICDAGLTSSKALLTSANFSETAQRYNLEGGWLVSSPWRVQQISDHYHSLISSGLLTQIYPSKGHKAVSLL